MNLRQTKPHRPAKPGCSRNFISGFHFDQRRTPYRRGTTKVPKGVPGGSEIREMSVDRGRRYEKRPSDEWISERVLCCRVSWRGVVRVSLGASSGSGHADQHNGHQCIRRGRIREPDSGAAPDKTSSQLHRPGSADRVHRRSQAGVYLQRSGPKRFIHPSDPGNHGQRLLPTRSR